jgi:2-oxo-4-hydroxy-4-carboxy-5-ureidoimidazoline decarboxylase
MGNNPRFRVLPSTLSREDFLDIYGGVYEYSPHFAARVFDTSAPNVLDTLEELASALRLEVHNASPDEKLALIRAHPDLANRLRASPLLPSSVREQASAGLDQCQPDELEKFLALNTAYRAKFGFPFIKAVRGFTRRQILQEFEARLGNDPTVEFSTALEQIHRIAWLRLSELT